LSGGVDSSVAAFILKESFPQLFGASHFIWPESRCCSLEVFSRAKAVCRRLDIPYFEVDLHGAFKDTVVGNFVETYLNGKTPNPCILCNKVIRFDLFYHGLEKLLRRENLLRGEERLRFSTGHYARIEKNEEGLFLKKALDPLKDQTYMLYRLSREMLSRFVFPLGDYLKADVVKMAAAYGLEYSQVKESQDACFVDTDYVDFIARYTGLKAGNRNSAADAFEPGEIVDPEGNVLGHHRGTVHYTVGQRRGLGLGDGPWYVSRLDLQNHRLVVAGRSKAQSSRLAVEELNWFIEAPRKPFSCQVKIRYQSGEIPCRVEPGEKGVQVQLEDPEFVTPGQSAVFYREDLVLGGGIIS